MQMSEIFAAVKSLAENDTSIPDLDITMWVDQAINRINQALKANIPTTKGKPTTYIPEFDERFHESLVLFAVGKYRESDAELNIAEYFMGSFNDMLMGMQRDMNLLPSTRKDNDIQQIVVTDIAILSYSLNANGSYFDVLEVYVNDKIVNSSTYSINKNNQLIIFKTALVLNDKITIVFENSSDLNKPPYQWWGQSGW